VVELHKSLKRKGGRLVLAGPNARVREVLSLTRIDAIVPVFDCLETAEIALNGRGAAAALQGGVLC
jgi:anti-anti-sigma regulatory factor